MAAAIRADDARGLDRLKLVFLLAGICVLLLSAAWASWRWQHSSTDRCGVEPVANSTAAAQTAHDEWAHCRADTQADRTVPVALAVFAVMVVTAGIGMTLRSGASWLRMHPCEVGIDPDERGLSEGLGGSRR
jgi:hypothetical protein